MTSVSFRMAGTGNWKTLLPDEEAGRLYTRMYPAGLPLRQIEKRFSNLVTSWQKSGIATITGHRLLPLGPIVTDKDLTVLAPWFRDISAGMVKAILNYLADYQRLAISLCGPDTLKSKINNLVTILTCAQALDVWAFQALRHKLIGPYPPRGSAGRFFFWGYAFSDGPKRIFGVSTYGPSETVRVSVLRSRGLDRAEIVGVLTRGPTLAYLEELCLSNRRASKGYGAPYEARIVSSLRDVALLEPDEPVRLAIPIFHDKEIEKVVPLHSRVSRCIVSVFATQQGELRRLISQCSFARCSLPDVLSMTFHLAYSYAADGLVLAGSIPDFPKRAGGEWGVWIRLIGQ